MGSPKAWPVSGRGRRMVAMRWGQCCYKLLYTISFLAAAYAVLAHFRAAAPIHASELDDEKPPGQEEPLQNKAVPAVVLSRAEQEQVRWIDKPNSLCFGLGNVTILSVAIDLPKAYLVQLRKNRLSYASLHGYRYCEVSTTLDFSRPIPWTKVKAMALLLSFADIVVAMEADVIIRNRTVRIESIFDLVEYNVTDKDVIYTTDFQQERDAEIDQKVSINTGVYIMHSTPWTKAFLEIQYNFYRTSIFQKNWEHDAVLLYRMKHAEEFHEHVAVIPYRYMNSPCTRDVNRYEDGDFVAHYAEEHSVDKYKELASQLATTDL